MVATSTHEVEERLVEICEANGSDWGLKLEVCHESMWSAELRITPDPNAEGADVSLLYYVVAQPDPETAMVKVFNAFIEKSTSA